MPITIEQVREEKKRRDALRREEPLQLIAGEEPSLPSRLFEKYIREPITEHTGLFPYETGLGEPVEQPILEKLGEYKHKPFQIAPHVIAEGFSGFGLSVPDIAAHLYDEDVISFAELVDKYTGYEPEGDEGRATEITGKLLKYHAGLSTLGKVVSPAVAKLPIREFLRNVVGVGGQIGGVNLAEQISELVTKDEPISWQELGVSTSIGFGLGSVNALLGKIAIAKDVSAVRKEFPFMQNISRRVMKRVTEAGRAIQGGMSKKNVMRTYGKDLKAFAQGLKDFAPTTASVVTPPKLLAAEAESFIGEKKTIPSVSKIESAGGSLKEGKPVVSKEMTRNIKKGSVSATQFLSKGELDALEGAGVAVGKDMRVRDAQNLLSNLDRLEKKEFDLQGIEREMVKEDAALARIMEEETSVESEYFFETLDSKVDRAYQEHDLEKLEALDSEASFFRPQLPLHLQKQADESLESLSRLIFEESSDQPPAEVTEEPSKFQLEDPQVQELKGLVVSEGEQEITDAIAGKKREKLKIYDEDNIPIEATPSLSSLTELQAESLGLEPPKPHVQQRMDDLNLSSREQGRLWKASRNQANIVNSVLDSIEQKGLSQDKQRRDLQIKNYQERAHKMRKRQAKKKSLSAYEWKETKKLPELSNMRHVMSELDQSTGLPFSDTWLSMMEGKIEGGNRAIDILLSKLEEKGISLYAVINENLQTPTLNKALFEEDPVKRQELIDQLTTKQIALFEVAQDILQGDAAHAIREHRWWRWSQAVDKANQAQSQSRQRILEDRAKKLKPKDIKKEDETRILSEGRQAQQEGRLSEWIRTQTFGTRAQFFMSEPITQPLSEQPFAPSELKLGLEHIRPLDEPTSRALETRRGAPEAMQRPLLQALMYHLRRALIGNNLKETFESFNDMFERIEPSSNDRVRMQRTLNNIMGMHQEADIFTRVAERLTQIFWRLFPLQVKKAVHFFTRNSAQPVIVASQLSSKRASVSAAKAFSPKRNPLMAQTLEEEHQYVSQKRAYQEQFMLLRETGAQFLPGEAKTKLKKFGLEATLLADWIGKFIVPLSDEVGRAMLSWPTFHQSGYDAFQNYQARKNLSQLRLDLRFDTLEIPQQEKLLGYLEDGNLKEFCRYFARFKTENTHFVYDLAGRSLTEQSRAGKVFTGLITFPRGIANIVYRNGLKTFARGMRTKDGRTLYQGLAAILGLYVGMRVGQEALYFIGGKRYKDDYSSIDMLTDGYNPLSIGAQTGIKLYDVFTNRAGKIIEKHGFTPEAVDKIGQLISNNVIEPYMPLVDVYVSAYENQENKAGAKLWTAVRSQLSERYEANHGHTFKYAERTVIQKIKHFFGGEELPELKKSFGEMTPGEKAQRILGLEMEIYHE